jgi:hypothetical protein
MASEFDRRSLNELQSIHAMNYLTRMSAEIVQNHSLTISLTLVLSHSLTHILSHVKFRFGLETLGS